MHHIRIKDLFLVHCAIVAFSCLIIFFIKKCNFSVKENKITSVKFVRNSIQFRKDHLNSLGPVDAFKHPKFLLFFPKKKKKNLA